MNEKSDTLENCFNDFMQLLGRTLSLSWNVFMKILVALGLMPVFRRSPKLLVVFIIILSCLFYYITALFVGMSFMALMYEVKADNDFMIDVARTHSNEEDKSC